HPASYRSFFTDPPTPDTYTLSLHDALPIFERLGGGGRRGFLCGSRRLRHRRVHPSSRGLLRRGRTQADLWTREPCRRHGAVVVQDRKSTRLNSSHVSISYAVFCLKKKKQKK